MKKEQMLQHLRSGLKPGRYKHTIGVSETALKLARIYGADEKKAEIAGLLHDCARIYETAVLTNKAEELGIIPDIIEQQAPILLHAKIGELMSKSVYNVEDEEIARAIRLHTTGGSNMSVLDEIIYLADMIEPSRDFPGVEKLRELAVSNLEEAMLAAYNHSIVYMMEKNQLIHPDTLTARNEILLR